MIYLGLSFITSNRLIIGVFESLCHWIWSGGFGCNPRSDFKAFAFSLGAEKHLPEEDYSSLCIWPCFLNTIGYQRGHLCLALPHDSKIHLHSESKIHRVRSHVSDFLQQTWFQSLPFIISTNMLVFIKLCPVFVQKIWSLSLSTLCVK